MHHHSRHLAKGIAYILLSWFFFASMGLLARFAKEYAAVPTILCVQSFVSWILILPWVMKGGFKWPRAVRFDLVFLRAVVGTLGFGLLFLAVQKTSLVDAILLNNAAPLFLPFVTLFWRKLPINHKLWPGIIIGFIGILLILKPGKSILDIGALYALGSAVTLSISMTAIRLLSHTDKNRTILFYYFLIGFCLSLPLALYYWTPLPWTAWALLITLGLCALLGQWTFNVALQFGKPSQLGPFCYMAVVYAGFFDWILWDKVPDLYAWTGILLVCAGGIWNIRFSKPTITDSPGE